jgi:hypothetical protein
VQVARGVLARRRAARDRQEIRRNCQETFDRKPPRDILDMWISSAVLVDDDDRGTFALGLRPRHVSVDLELAGREGRLVDGKARVVLRNRGGLGIVVLKEREQRRGCGCRSRKCRKPVEEAAPAHATVRKLVVEVDNSLVHEVLPEALCPRH